MIKAGQTWRRKADGKAFVINWVSDELVTITENGSLVTTERDKFLQDFEKCGFNCKECGHYHAPHQCRTSECENCYSWII